MPTYLIMIIAAVAVLALFILGMSITLMIKGRYMQSEIGDNPHMQKLGIKCAVRESVEEERQIRGREVCLPISCGASADCAVCEER